MSDILQSSVFWVGFFQWLLFFPLVRFAQQVLIPESNRFVEAALELAVLAIGAGVLLLVPLWASGNLPLPRGTENRYYMWAFIIGGLLSVPLRALTTRRSENR